MMKLHIYLEFFNLFIIMFLTFLPCNLTMYLVLLKVNDPFQYEYLPVCTICGVEAGWVGWVTALPLFCLTFIEN